MDTDTVESTPKTEHPSPTRNTTAPAGCSFLIQKTNPEDIFITEEWSEEAKMIYDTTKEFCVKEIFEVIKKRGAEFDVHHDLEEVVAILDKAAGLGLCGVSIAEEFGGIDLDFNACLLYTSPSPRDRG